MIEWNARRLAVLDRDIDAIIRTHARERKVAAWLEDTAEAFEEIGEIDLAIGWAKQATDFDRRQRTDEGQRAALPDRCVGWQRCASWPAGRPRQPELTSSSPSSVRRTAVGGHASNRSSIALAYP